MNSVESSMTLLDLFQMGGVFMWPLLLFSIATISIAIERAFFITNSNLKVSDLVEKTKSFLDEKNIEGAKDYLSSQKDTRFGAKIFYAILNTAGLSEHRMEKAGEIEAATCINSLENGFDFLNALGSIAPLTGFLGTVSGMIGAFKSIAEATEVNAQIVANGIYEALITTVFGLIIAIVAMVVSSLLSHNVDKFASDVETGCSEFIARLSN
jgi:biopolymer transport protein ExbB